MIMSSVVFVTLNCCHVPQYEDEEHDKVILASDDDLATAVDHAKLAGWMVRQHLIKNNHHLK